LDYQSYQKSVHKFSKGVYFHKSKYIPNKKLFKNPSEKQGFSTFSFFSYFLVTKKKLKVHAFIDDEAELSDDGILYSSDEDMNDFLDSQEGFVVSTQAAVESQVSPGTMRGIYRQSMLSQQSPSTTGFSKPVKAYANRYKLQLDHQSDGSSPEARSSPSTSSADTPKKYSVFIEFISYLCLEIWKKRKKKK
jgi:hypothetical protein